MHQLTTASIQALTIVLARYEAGMSQQDLADAMGYLDKQRISNIESGTENLTAIYIDKLIIALNTTHQHFLELQLEAHAILLQNEQQYLSTLTNHSNQNINN